MCGILGVLPAIEKLQFEHSLNTLAHRGPDGSGIWGDPKVMLGHRRLAILDLSAQGNQPMLDVEGRYVIVFNGEIYNFLELRQELQKKGHQFHSDTDTEVVLAAFKEWREDCLQKFNGAWAFAIWDKQEHALFLSRDRFGKKPLFYTQLPNERFAFASEMKALFPLLGEVRANIELAKDTSKIFLYEATDECPIKGISRFSAGHSGWLIQGRLKIKRWWNTLDHLHGVPERYEEQVEQFRELFLDSCRIRMRCDVPLGTALSGGLDSSATISAMAHIAAQGHTPRMGENWQHAIVASFPGTPLDETRYACEVSKHIGIKPVVVEIDPLKEIANLNRHLYLFEDLYFANPLPFMQTYGAVKANGVSVTLDGHGADELFGGYPNDFVIALEDAGWNLPQARKIISAFYDVTGDNAQLNRNLPSRHSYFAKWYRNKGLRLAKQGARTLLGKSRTPPPPHNRHPRWEQLDNLSQRLYVSTHETILPTLLRNYDRYSMANGVEVRMPFMDHRIVTLAFSLPWTAKVRGGYSKAIVRDAMAPFMPHQIAYRKTKIGFNSPIVNWMQGPLKNYLLDTIASQSFQDCELINPMNVAHQIQQVIDNPVAKFTQGQRAWTMFSPYLWEQAVIKQKWIA